MISRDDYIRTIQATLDEWNAEMDFLTGKAGEFSTEVRNDFDELIKLLKEKQAADRQKITELQQAGENAWEDLKPGIDLAWTAKCVAIDSARSRFI